MLASLKDTVELDKNSWGQPPKDRVEPKVESVYSLCTHTLQRGDCFPFEIFLECLTDKNCRGIR